MKRILPIFFLLLPVFCAPADCPDKPCPPGTNSIGDCPDEGCRKKAFDPDHPYDPELNKRKNIRSDDQPAVVRSIRWIKALPDPTNLTEWKSRRIETVRRRAENHGGCLGTYGQTRRGRKVQL